MTGHPPEPPKTLHPIVQRVQPSVEQLPAVLTRGQDVLVSAGAGTGKTRTLTARILALLAEDVPLRSIVAVTFTIRAASEMRNRLRTEVQEYLATPGLDAAEYGFWSSIAAQMDSARIGTIHGLCTEILRAHPAEALLDPNFSILEDAQTLVLKRVAVDGALAQLLADPSPDAMLLLERLGAANLREALGDMVSSEVEEDGTVEDRVARLQHALNDIGEGAARFLRDEAAADAIAILRLALAETRLNEASLNDGAASSLLPTIAAWEAAQRALGEGNTLEALVAALPIASLSRNRGNKQNWHRHFPKTQYGVLLDLWASYVALPEKSDPHADLDLIAVLPALLRTRDDARHRYAMAKEELRALDFDDLEVRAHRLLQTDVLVRARWQQEVAALLVDEFQDTNSRQRDLLRAIAGTRGVLFMVGDAKQSIYRFRGADVRVFRAERARVAADSGAAFTLDQTFRSHPALLDSLNALLAGAMESETSEEFREPFAPLVSGDPAREARTPAPWVEVQIALGAKGDGALDNAASALALRLVELKQAGYAWEEMVLLCRRARAFEKYEDAFERAGIPYVTVAGSGFHDRPEIRDVLNLLRAIADPTDNLAVAGFMRSPVIGFSDADLLALFATLPAEQVRHNQPGIWWRALAQSGSAQADRAVALLNELGAMAGRATVAAVLKRLLDLTCYEAALTHIDNDRGARNLAKLLEDAQSSPQLSISQFLASIDELRAARGRSGEAYTGNIGSVQIMTVHKAKGLEFPIVAIGDAGAKGGGQRGDLLVAPDLGPLLPMKQENEKSGILYQRAVALEQAMESAESDRLLYVAATRACEVLIFNGVGGVTSTGEPKLDGWLRALALPLDLKSAYAANPQISAISRSQSSMSGDATPLRGSISFGLEHNVAGLVVTARLQTPPAAPSNHAPLDSDFDARMVSSLTTPATTTRMESVRDAARDQLGGSVITRAKAPAPPHVVGSLVHFALEEEIEPQDARFEGWVAARAASLGVRDEESLRGLRARLARLLERYYASALHAEVKRASDVRREIAFTLLAQTSRAVAPGKQNPQLSFFAEEQTHPPESKESRRPVQGAIDLLYRSDAGEWVIVDFKSESFSGLANALKQIESRTDYLQQLRAYGEAVSQLIGATPRLRLCLLDDHNALSVIEIS